MLQNGIQSGLLLKLVTKALGTMSEKDRQRLSLCSALIEELLGRNDNDIIEMLIIRLWPNKDNTNEK